MSSLKTTVDISDALFRRAKRYAAQTGRPMRALIEEGLRLVLESEAKREGYRLPDRSVGIPGRENPLQALSWQDLREEIYGGR